MYAGVFPGICSEDWSFSLIFPHLPAGLYSVVGIVGGIGVGFSASYGWQAVFNSWEQWWLPSVSSVFRKPYFSESLKTFSGLVRSFVLQKNISHCNRTKTWIKNIIFRLLFMVRLCVYDSITSIYLFQQNHSHQLMWEGHLGKTKSIIRSCKHSFSKTDRTADYKCNTAFPLYPEFSIFAESSSDESIAPPISRVITYISSFITFKIRSPSFVRIASSTVSLAWSGVFSSATSTIVNLQYLLSLFEYSAIASFK